MATNPTAKPSDLKTFWGIFSEPYGYGKSLENGKVVKSFNSNTPKGNSIFFTATSAIMFFASAIAHYTMKAYEYTPKEIAGITNPILFAGGGILYFSIFTILGTTIKYFKQFNQNLPKTEKKEKNKLLKLKIIGTFAATNFLASIVSYVAFNALSFMTTTTILWPIVFAVVGSFSIAYISNHISYFAKKHFNTKS